MPSVAAVRGTAVRGTAVSSMSGGAVALLRMPSVVHRAERDPGAATSARVRQLGLRRMGVPTMVWWSWILMIMCADPEGTARAVLCASQVGRNSLLIEGRSETGKRL